MSNTKEEGAMLDEITRSIAPEHLLPTVNQLCGKTMDFLFQYSQVARCHVEGQNSTNGKLHRQALEYIKPVAKKIGVDLHEKINMIVQVMDLGPDVDIDKALHLFLCINLLIESTVALGLDSEQMQASRAGIKTPLVETISRTFHRNKVDVIASFLVDDSWSPDATTLCDVRVVKPLLPDAYRSVVKEVKRYLVDLTDTHENPFYSERLLAPQDLSGYFETETYGEAAAAAGAKVTTNGASSVPQLPTDRGLMTASGVLVVNTMLEYVAKVAVRFPPLAPEILQWCEQLACIYIYSVGNTFVSVSREVPLENQSDFSPNARRMLSHISEMCEKAFAYSGREQLNAIKQAAPQLVPVLSSPQHSFGTEFRLAAVESCFAVLAALRATVGSLAKLMKREPLEEWEQRSAMLTDTVDELLHVIVHRLCQAIPLVAEVPDSLAKVKFNGRDLAMSPYTTKLAASVIDYVQNLRIDFALPHFRTIYIRRLVFAVQVNMAAGYAKQAKKLTDMQIAHMQQDAQGFAAAIESGLGAGMIPLPRYTRDFVIGAFDFVDKTQPNKWKEWLVKNHAFYARDSLRNMISNGDKDRRQEVDEYLGVLGHVEMIPTRPLRVGPETDPTSRIPVSPVTQ
jgi:hypothetical protein